MVLGIQRFSEQLLRETIAAGLSFQEVLLRLAQKRMQAFREAQWT